MNSAPNVGIERAFKRELGLSLEELSDEWREAMQTKHLPQVATLDRARKFSQPLLDRAPTSGGSLFLAPSLSSDGKYIAFVSLRQLPARRSLPRPLARRRRDGQAHQAAREERRPIRTSRSCACSTRRARSRPTASRSRSRRSAKARTCCTCSTCGAARRRQRFDLAARGRDEPVVVARRQADRVQRQQRRHHRPVHRRSRRHASSAG